MVNNILQDIPASFILIIGSLLLPFSTRYLRMAVILVVPAITLIKIWSDAFILRVAPVEVTLGKFTLLPIVAHPYTLIFATAFAIAILVGGLYGSLQSRTSEIVAGFIYAGSAIGVCFSGDYVTLFLYWEIMAIASTVIIFSSPDKSVGRSGVRYAIMHFFSGVLLLAGIVAQYNLTGSFLLEGFNADMGILFPESLALDMNGLIIWLILLSFLIGAAACPLSAWLPDNYPRASHSGSVLLSAFTTKTSVFVLLTLFAGTKLLVFIGLFMAFYGIIYAILENDVRRVLAYSIINQVGFMIVGIGIGTNMALNGVATHAFCHIMYKALLFMSAGSVVYMTGKNKLSEMGGLFGSMKLTAICGIIGALAISSFPLTSGFVSKTIITATAADEGLSGVWFLLLAASAGVFLHAGIKFPWFVFFAKDSGMRPSEPPYNMRIAMVILAAICIIPAIPGLTEPLLYSMLPSKVDFVAYTASHVVTELQLLLFSALAFFIMLPLLKRTNTISLDFDWFYRVFARYIFVASLMLTKVPRQYWRIFLKKIMRRMEWLLHVTHGPGSIMERSWKIGTTLTWTIFLLGIYLAIYYVSGGNVSGVSVESVR